MKSRFLIALLFVTVLLSCNTKHDKQANLKLSADSLVANIGQYINQKVEIEGVVGHICGVDGRKMKLKTDGGEIIKVISSDPGNNFNKSLYNKRLLIYGIATEDRMDKLQIEKFEREKKLLCHIDNWPCKDTAWANRQVISGVADSLSAKDIARVEEKMNKTGKEYISVVVVVADKYTVLDSL